jgi:hypothetical protein
MGTYSAMNKLQNINLTTRYTAAPEPVKYKEPFSYGHIVNQNV